MFFKNLFISFFQKVGLIPVDNNLCSSFVYKQVLLTLLHTYKMFKKLI